MNIYLVELEKWLFKWKMKISVEKSCSMIFTKNTKEISIYGNRIESLKEIKFLGIIFDSKLTFSSMIEEIKERCNSRLNLIKILSNKKWGLDLNTLGNLYNSLLVNINLYFNFQFWLLRTATCETKETNHNLIRSERMVCFDLKRWAIDFNRNTKKPFFEGHESR
ncbi:RNA-directed DNA polymerase from mobile element jockey-like [Brachionus plicatilis]|uniref:RNA-directed DNA polymerase from mobile element jockey-like n=1 Tax=Brachionus plicatilis TaxID=10195 RepID=A0A3M7Q618_BRAPC|nr:RNA-directed DNA polymerase from mobile element jockey-like [Brachionus plicatilis]